jgi:hypothetical protein
MKKRMLAAVAATTFAVTAFGTPVAAVTVAQCKAEANALLNNPTSRYYPFRFLAQWSPSLWNAVLTNSCIRAGATP